MMNLKSIIKLVLIGFLVLSFELFVKKIEAAILLMERCYNNVAGWGS